ncbi:YhdP family protein [Dokdonella sp. MW10]|uniref:YhdP family protein n=1 Tax=Dokdonella sp. MW10 TaxID=2992926 RepID=UPI003F8180D5
MTTPRRWRRVRFALVSAVAGTLVLVAVLMGLAQLALPWLVRNPQRVEAWLSERSGREVRIGTVEGQWTRGGPRLVLEDVRLGPSSPGGRTLTLPHAELAVNLFAALQRNRAWNEFRLVGLDLALSRGDDGAWQLHGLDLDVPEGADATAMPSMGALGALVLVDLKLAIADPAKNLDLALHVPELRVINRAPLTHVLGRVALADSPLAGFAVVADVDLERRSGRVYVAGNELDLARFGSLHAPGGIALAAGTADVEVWGEWRDGRVVDVRTRLGLAEAVLAATKPVDATDTLAVLPRALFEHLGLLARWRREGDGWNVDIADANVTRQGETAGPARIVMARAGDGETRVEASGVDLGTPAAIAMLADALPSAMRRWLYLSSPRGTLAGGTLRWRSAQDFDVDAHVEGVVVRGAAKIPGIDPLELRVRGDAQGLLAEIPASPTRIDYPGVFRKPFVYDAFGGELAAWPDDLGMWHVQTPAFVFDARDHAGEIRGGLVFQGDGTRPLLDATAIVHRAEVPAAKLFWPITTMSANTIGWLDRALVSGQVVAGRVAVHGDLDRWPFADLSGRFEARASIRDLTLDYLEHWPEGRELDVEAAFINNGMQAEATGGSVQALRLESATAEIASFAESRMLLHAKAEGEGKALLGFLRSTPVGERFREPTRGLSIGGTGKADVKIDVPLKRSEDLVLDGSVDLADADLVDSTWSLRFPKVNGRVNFRKDALAAPELKAMYGTSPVTLGVAVGAAVRDARNVFEATLGGTLPASAVFERAPDLPAAVMALPGSAHWDIAVGVGARPDVPNTLNVRSDLAGITLGLPAPLEKAPEAALPFALDIELPPSGRPFSMRLGSELAVRGTLPTDTTPLAALLDFGGEATRPVPTDGIAIGGRVGAVDAGGWMGLLGGAGDAIGTFRGLGLDVGELRVAGRRIPDVRVDIEPGDDTRLRFAGPSLEGEITLPPFAQMARRGVTAQFKRLHWPEAPEGSEAALSGIAPSTIPPLRLWVGDLRFGNGSFGEARLESSPTSEGMRIDLLETKSPNVDIRASGTWNGDASASRSQLRIDMTAHSLGRMLDALGFAGIIDGGATLAHIDAGWPGGPTSFALADLDGALEVTVDKGRILDVDPGAGGRLFGLLSLREIPRRLSLDFSDLFKSGMSFNSIEGRFALRDGNAFAERLHINSPAADIEITGRTGLRGRDYDQQMVVTPRAGVALPVVGALAGGPVGAAAGLVVQGLVGKQINQAARSRYQVAGTWDKPVITLLSRETPKGTPKAESGKPAVEQTEPAGNGKGGRR